MGWLDKFFRKAPKNWIFAPTFDGYTPIYSQFGTDIYASDVVQQALKCIVDEMKKTTPTHVRVKNNDPSPVKGNVQDVLNNPNKLMTTSEFIEKTVWMLLMNYNAFIIPTYYTWADPKTGEERRYFDSLYPINPTQVDFIEDAGGRLFVTFWFWNGETTTIPYDDVIHIKYNYSLNEYMGGNRFGQPDNKPLLDTLNLNQTMLQGIAKAMNSSYQVNAVVKYNTMLDDGKMEANVRELERKLQEGKSGFLPMDLKGEFIPFPKDIKMVDEGTLKFIDEKILRNWGIPLAILTGDYTKEQYEAFYQKTLEPLITAMSQAFTKKMFTSREKAFGNQIKFYPKDLIFMTISQKLELVNLLAPTGAVYENEKRTMFGLMPLEELEGKRYMSLNWVDADMAAQYQMGKVGNVNMDVIDENKDESISYSAASRIIGDLVMRFNPNHGSDGKFATTGGSGGGGFSALSNERADEMLGSELDNVLSHDNEYHDMTDALKNYTYGAHDAENKILRGRSLDGEFDADDIELFKEDISNIEKAIDEFDVKENIKVYRKTNGDFKNMRVGDSFQDDGFGSTSTSKDFVDKFDGANHELKDDAYTLEINVPKGKGKGAYIKNVSDYPEEYEFLLQRGTQFTVDSVDHDSKTLVVTISGNERKGL